jgi:hypothetical protein
MLARATIQVGTARGREGGMPPALDPKAADDLDNYSTLLAVCCLLFTVNWPNSINPAM